MHEFYTKSPKNLALFDTYEFFSKPYGMLPACLPKFLGNVGMEFFSRDPMLLF